MCNHKNCLHCSDRLILLNGWLSWLARHVVTTCDQTLPWWQDIVCQGETMSRLKTSVISQTDSLFAWRLIVSFRFYFWLMRERAESELCFCHWEMCKLRLGIRLGWVKLLFMYSTRRCCKVIIPAPFPDSDVWSFWE